MPALFQRGIISFLDFITLTELILFRDRLDGLDAPGISHTKIKTHAWISLWRDMNLSTWPITEHTD